MRAWIYTLDVAPLRDEKTLARFKEAVRAERLAKAEALRQTADRARSIGAGLLLAVAYGQYMELLELTGESADAGSSSCAMKRCLVHRNEKGTDVCSIGVSFAMPLKSDEILEPDMAYERGETERVYTLEELCKLKEALPKEMEGEKGKPYFSSGPFFNISHAGDMAALVVSDAEAGIDIERLRPCKRGVMRRCFSPEESKRVETAGSEQEKDLRFTELWTQKEAAAKYTGGGIGDIMGGKKPDGIITRTVRLNDCYVLSVCVQKD